MDYDEDSEFNSTMNSITSNGVLLSVIHNCDYEFFEDNRYSIPQFVLNNKEYNPICNNGFTKIRTPQGNNYWLLQNEKQHLTPDWKFHISVCHSDLVNAWNLISSLYLSLGGWEGMKVMYRKESSTVPGREITVYIYRVCSELKHEIDYCEERSEAFWLNFAIKTELILKRNNIISNGCAKGDLKLGKYISLRNESYVLSKDEYIYPLDTMGWNGASQEPPFDISKFLYGLRNPVILNNSRGLKAQMNEQGAIDYSIQTKCSITYILLAFAVFVISLGYAMIQTNQ